MNIFDCIGKTPLLQLKRSSRICDAQLYLKAETQNFTHSVYDRIILEYFRRAMRRGELKRGGCVVAAGKGNFSLALASICTLLDMRLLLCSPASISNKEAALLQALGAHVILTPAEEGMEGARSKADFHYKDTWRSFQPDLTSEDAIAACEGIGKEIAEDAEKQGFIPDALLCSSGCVLMGAGKILRQKYPSIHIVEVKPGMSPLTLEGAEQMEVTEENALQGARRLLSMEAIQAGFLTGAQFSAAIALARRPEQHKNIVFIALE